MKTNEEKLKILLEVSVENEFKGILGYDWILDINNLAISVLVTEIKSIDYSLNDLVLNYEEGEISFIDSLVTTVRLKLDNYSYWKWVENNNLLPSSLIEEAIKTKWILLPTSKRLEFLFETFEELLVS